MTRALTGKDTNPEKGRSCFFAEELARQYDLFADSVLIKQVLDALPGIVIILNQRRQIIFANRAFCELSGRQSSDLLCGLLIGDVLSCHIAHETEYGCGSGDSCESCGALAAMLASETGNSTVQECMITRQNNNSLQSLTLRVWTAPLQYAGQDFIILAGVDISHERRRLALERTFFHDIMNLVGSIRGFAELMEVDDSLDPLEVSRRIQLASQRVIEEIDTQRLLLAVEKGDFRVDNHMLDSLLVLKDITDLYEGHDLARGRRIDISAEAAKVPFLSDATLLRRILGNMLKNALEATPQGEVVKLGAESDGERLKFWVHNQAVIPNEYQQGIFQRDFSTKGTGRGLGTYSMRLLGRYLSGEVSFTSGKGNGTRFVLSIPIALKEVG